MERPRTPSDTGEQAEYAIRAPQLMQSQVSGSGGGSGG